MKLENFKSAIAASCLILTLIVGSAISIAGQTNDKLTAEIERTVRAMYDAFIGRDEAGFNGAIADGGFLCDEYGYIEAAQFKKEIAGYFKSTPKPNTKLSYELSDLKVIHIVDEFRGKRVRLTGWLKTDAANKAGLWMRVDGNRRTLGFDNMDDRAVTGTTDWKQYSVVLDVPNEAVNLYFGTLVQGAGNVWTDDFKLEIVGSDIAVTDRNSAEDAKRDNGRDANPDANKKTFNLDFEMGAVPATKK